MNILICDDDQSFCSEFSDLLNKELSKHGFDQNKIEIQYENFKINEALDLYFIDVNLGNISGFKLMNSIIQPNKNSLIIYISANENNVYDSFNYSVFDFIRKSSLKPDLERILKRISSHFKNEDCYYCVNRNRIIKIKLKDIILVDKYKNDIRIVTLYGEFYERKKMYEVRPQLNENFYQLTRSVIINFENVTAVKKDGFLLKNNNFVAFHTKRKGKALEIYYNYLSR